MEQIQQGDVTLEMVGSLPHGAIAVKTQVLAEGEVTGHVHRITEVDTSICQLYEKDGTLYVKATKPVSLVHEEHKTVTIPEGIWEVGRVKEYDYLNDMVRNIKD